jgi:hypothetical protein
VEAAFQVSLAGRSIRQVERLHLNRQLWEAPNETASPVQAAQLSVRFPTMTQFAKVENEPVVCVSISIVGNRPGPNL